MKRLATLVSCAALIGAALTLCTAAAYACSPVTAPALHTAAHPKHRAHAHRSQAHLAHVVHHASFGNAPLARLPVLPPRAPAHHSERKAALPVTLHTARHAPGSHARFGANLHSMLAENLAAPGPECALTPADLDYSPGMSLTLAGRAPPRAGPCDALVPLSTPQRPFAPRRAGFDPPAFRRSFVPIADLCLASGPAAGACGVAIPVSPEPPCGRSHADRPGGAAAWRTMPSSRGSS